MKIKKITIVTLLACLTAGFTFMFAGGKHHHGEKGHGETHKLLAPNGGRLVKFIDTSAEIFVAEDGRVRVSFLSETGEIVPSSGRIVSLVGGDRMNPIHLQFTEADGVLVSEGVLPLESTIPVVIQFQNAEEEGVTREKFMLNMSSCSSCDYKEYACRCHDDPDESGHGHDH